MDRATLQQLLREAERLVERDERNVIHQRQIIGTLERAGQDATIAKAFLGRLEGRLARHIGDRGRLIEELEGKP